MKERRNGYALTSLILLCGLSYSVHLFIEKSPTWSTWGLVRFVAIFLITWLIGVWVNSQIILTLLYNFPRSIYLWSRSELRFNGVLIQLIAPTLWLCLLFTLALIWPGSLRAFEKNLAAVAGAIMSSICVLISLFTPAGLRDLRFDFERGVTNRFRRNADGLALPLRNDAVVNANDDPTLSDLKLEVKRLEDEMWEFLASHLQSDLTEITWDEDSHLLLYFSMNFDLIRQIVQTYRIKNPNSEVSGEVLRAITELEFLRDIESFIESNNGLVMYSVMHWEANHPLEKLSDLQMDKVIKGSYIDYRRSLM